LGNLQAEPASLKCRGNKLLILFIFNIKQPELPLTIVRLTRAPPDAEAAMVKIFYRQFSHNFQ